MPTNVSPDGMHEISYDECVALLRDHEHGVGRVAIIHQRRPRIFPVNYVMSDDRVLFCSDEGTKLDAAWRRSSVEFEVDHIDRAARTGWSVVVAGIASVVTDENLVMLLGSHRLEPFAPGPKRHWVVIEPGRISGRRVPGPSHSWIR